MAAGAKALDRANSRTTKLHRLEENLGAASITLTGAEVADLSKAAAQIAVVGDRYPEKLEQMTNL